jgi:hypothetical protein
MAPEDKILILSMILSAGFVFWTARWKSRPAEVEVYPFIWFFGIAFFFRGRIQAEVMLMIILAAYIFISTRIALLSGDEDKKNLWAYFLGWLVPGWGYYSIGKKGKAIFFFCSILLISLIGLTLTGFKSVGWEDNPFYYLGRYGCGIMYAFFETLGAAKAEPVSGISLGIYEAGLLYCCLAGILNLTICFSVLSPKK